MILFEDQHLAKEVMTVTEFLKDSRDLRESFVLRQNPN